MKSRMSPIALFALICAMPIACTARVTTEEAVSRMRDRLIAPFDGGGWQTVEWTGSGEAMGMDMTMTFRFDDSGRFVLEASGNVVVAAGYDGETTWKQDPDGHTRVLTMNNARHIQLSHWMLTGFWIQRDAPIDITASDTHPGRHTMALDVALIGSSITGVLLVDTRTWLPLRFTVNDFGMDNVIHFDAWQKVAGRSIPKEVAISNGGREASRFVIETCRADADAGRSMYAPQAARITLQYDTEGAGPVPTKRGRWGHHFVRPRINGHDIAWVAFDTGAGMTFLDEQLANDIGVEIIGASASTGMGGPVEERIGLVRSIELGPLRVENIPVKLGDARDVALGITDNKGLLAMDFLRHCVIEYDQAGSRIALYDPDNYALDGGVWTSMLAHNGKPTVYMPFEGHNGLFTIDTGCPGGVLVGHHTVEKYALLDGRDTTPTRVTGIGGQVDAEDGTLRWVEWGGRRFDDVEARFIIENKGTGADRSRDGIIGTDLLARYRVVFDMKHGRIAYLPN